MKILFASILLRYFRFFAQLQLLKIRPKIIGITGSAGKTSAMEAIAATLQDQYTLKVGRKANSESGIPLDILGLQPTDYSLLDWGRLLVLTPVALLTNWQKYDYYIVEMGIDSPESPRNMDYLLSIVNPHIGVFTSVGTVHSENFDHLISQNSKGTERQKLLVTAIATEKGKLIQALPSDGAAIINADYPEIITATKNTVAHIYSFGTIDARQIPTVQVGDSIWTPKGTTFSIHTLEEDLRITIPGYLLPDHFGATFCAAICVGLHLGISPYRTCRAIEKNTHFPPGRATLLSGIKQSTIIDSSYNSSAKPTIDFLHMLAKISQAKRKIALLGDIRELGSATQIEHEKVATQAVKSCDLVVLVGPQMKSFALPLIEEAGVEAHWFADAVLAGKFLKQELKANDWVLVKGSQNTLLLEIAVEMLLADPSQAPKVLSRRGAFWDKKRQAIISPHQKF